MSASPTNASKTKPGDENRTVAPDGSGADQAASQDATPAGASPRTGSPSTANASAADEDPTLPKVRSKAQRRIRWQWDLRLLAISAGVLVAVVGAGTVSYFYQSARSAQTFLQRADAAAAEGDSEEESKWLRRYSMLRPDDADALYRYSVALDDAAENATGQDLPRAVEDSRRQLGIAITRLPDHDSERQAEIRRRLIKRLVQSGDARGAEAESQIIALDAPPDDPEMLRGLALALAGQVRFGNYTRRSAEPVDPDSDPWRRLAAQPVVEVLRRAIDANPGDTDLIASLLEAVYADRDAYWYGIDRKRNPRRDRASTGLRDNASPDRQPAADDADDPEQQIASALRDAVEGLRERQDGRAHLLVYQYLARQDDPQAARDWLIESALDAAERLRVRAEQLATADASEAASAPDTAPQVWDYSLVLQAAAALAFGQFPDNEDIPRRVGELGPEPETPDLAAEQRRADESSPSRLQLAASLYEILISGDFDDVNRSLREQAYLGAGEVEAAQGDLDKAVRIWRDGLAKTDANSLPLLQRIATVTIGQGDADAAQAAVHQLAEGLERASLQLSTTAGGTLSVEARDAIARQQQIVGWDLLLLQATVAQLDGQRREAIRLLRRAVDSNVGVGNEKKVAASRQLASLYSQLGYWDMAAAALEQAVRLDPGNAELRAATGQAWARAGNARQAAQQWRAAESTGAIGAFLAVAQTELNSQLRRPPAERSFARVRDTIRRGHQTLDNVLAAADPDPERAAAVADIRWRLKALEITIPDGDTAFEQHSRSDAFVRSLDELATEFADRPQAQLYAAQRFLAIGDVDAARRCRERLAEIIGEEADPLVMIDAMILRAAGQPQEAVDRLLRLAAAKDSGKDSADDNADADTGVNALLRSASDIAASSGNTEQAYEILAGLAETLPQTGDGGNQAVGHFSRLAELAIRIPQESAIFQRADRPADPDALSAMWESRLRDVEGDEGTFWRYRRAVRLLERTLRESEGRPDPDEWSEVTRLVREILYRRPTWGAAVALDGRLMAIQGRNRDAVRRLEEATQAGERSLQTRQWLALALIRENRYQEATAVLDSLGSETVSGDGNLARMAVAANSAQGEFRRGLELAREAVTASPDDVASRVMLANQASLVLGSEPDADDREELILEAREALDTAKELAGDRQASVYFSRFRFESLHGDEQEQVALIEAVGDSKIPNLDRWKLLGELRRARGEWAEAEEALRRAERLQPDSLEIQLALADTYRRNGDQPQWIASLERARDLSPDNVNLRNQLAVALALQSGADIPWDRLRRLLDDDRGGDPSSQLLYALMLGSRGDDAQREQAIRILRPLADGQGESQAEATRALAGIYRLRWQQHDDPLDRRARQDLAEAKTLLGSLAEPRDAVATDLYRHADLLLVEAQRIASEELSAVAEARRLDPPDPDAVNEAVGRLADRTADLVAQADQIRDRLRERPDGTVYSLDVELRANQLQGSPRQADIIIDQWATESLARDDADRKRIIATAGSSLVQFGFPEQAIDWLRQAYEASPDSLGDYVIALNRAGQSDAALEVCSAHFAKHSDAQSAMLLAESLMSRGDIEPGVPEQAGRILQTAIGRFPTNPALLESVATVRLQEQQLNEALRLYQIVQKMSPDRLRTLNNMAMIYSEIPGQAAKGLPHIEKAIELVGENPELLDTKGVVLLKMGRLDEAETTFRQALESVDEPRFRFHLVMTLRAAKRDALAEQEWKKLDLENLDRSAITPTEREELDRIIEHYTPKL